MVGEGEEENHLQPKTKETRNEGRGLKATGLGSQHVLTVQPVLLAVARPTMAPSATPWWQCPQRRSCQGPSLELTPDFSVRFISPTFLIQPRNSHQCREPRPTQTQQPLCSLQVGWGMPCRVRSRTGGDDSFPSSNFSSFIINYSPVHPPSLHFHLPALISNAVIQHATSVMA